MIKKLLRVPLWINIAFYARKITWNYNDNPLKFAWSYLYYCEFLERQNQELDTLILPTVQYEFLERQKPELDTLILSTVQYEFWRDKNQN